jgi:two-component system phosphate regulon sensor histidine kinase PhoR
MATMVDGILMIDRNDAVTLVNRAAERLVSVSAPSLPLPLTALPIGEGLLPAVRKIRSNQPDATPLVIDEIIAPATRRSLRVVITPLSTAEQTQALIVLQDLTELRRAEQAQRAFLGNISHDLRTPLASLQAMIETLQDGALDDHAAAQDFLSRMDAEVQGLSRLVSELLELSRIESGRLSLHPAPTDLGSLLTTVARRMEAQAEQREITIDVIVPATMPTVMIDGPRIEQVLLNLLQNALTFTPRGGRITLGVTVHDDQVAISVQDTGIGIAPEDLPHIFDRFYKVDRARSGGGTGLGLAIAKHLVERHNGQIRAESEPENGTTVTFTLPISERKR